MRGQRGVTRHGGGRGWERTLVVGMGRDLGTLGALLQLGLEEAGLEGPPAVQRLAGRGAEEEEEAQAQDGEEDGGRAPRHGEQRTWMDRVSAAGGGEEQEVFRSGRSAPLQLAAGPKYATQPGIGHDPAAS